MVNDLIGDRFDHFRSGDVHISHVLGHDDEILESGRVNATARAGSHNDADLGYDTRSLDVTVENFTISIKAVNAFLDARAAAIVDADHGYAGIHGQIHHTGNFFSGNFTERTAHHGEILRVNADFSTVDGSETSNHTVTGDLTLVQTEIGVAVFHQAVDFLEGSLI